MPITLSDVIKLEKDPLLVLFTKNLLRQSDVLKIWPFSNVPGLVTRGLRYSALPSPGFRKLYGTYTDSRGTTEPVEESLAIFGSEFSVDRVLEKVKGTLFRDPLQEQMAMHSLAVARDWVYWMINGDVDVTVDGFDGLHKRATTLHAKTGRAIVDVDGAGTDAYPVLADAAHAQQFVKYLDVAMKYANLSVGESNKGAILMNETSWLGIQEAFKLAGYSIYTVDLLGKTWPSYMGIPFIDVGLKLDKSTEIITDTCTDPSDAGADATRLYVVRFTEPDGDVNSPGSDGLQGIQLSPLELLGPDEGNLKDVYNYEWVCGLSQLGDDYSLVEMDCLKFAAS
jgi:hypothetical protein